MNFLAHFHLAWPDEYLVVGGLEGDYFKGPLPGSLAPELQAGVRLHRAIDAYTDNHPELVRLRKAFPPELRRYAGILIDLCFDHCLARNWAIYSALPLPDFATRVYTHLQAHERFMSPQAQRMAGWLIEYEILQAYSHWDTVAGSAERIGRRLRRDNPMDRAGSLLEPMLGELQRSFEVFYPQLQQFSRDSVMLEPGQQEA